MQDVVDDLPRKQRAIADYIQQNPMECAGLTLDQLADVLKVNASTIIRAAQSLGYKGFGQMRQDLRHQYLATLSPLDILESNKTRAVNGHLSIAQIKSDLENLNTMLAHLDLSKLESLAQRISRAGRTLVVSSGSYAALGLVLTHQCSFISYNIELENRGGSYLAHRLRHLGQNDLLLGITFWKGSRDVVQALEWGLRHGVPTASITDNPRSRIARASRIALLAPTESTSFYQSMTAGMSLVYALVNAVWLQDPVRAENAARSGQQLYLDLNLQAPEESPHLDTRDDGRNKT